jgi:hypothetical protein
MAIRMDMDEGKGCEKHKSVKGRGAHIFPPPTLVPRLLERQNNRQCRSTLDLSNLKTNKEMPGPHKTSTVVS